MVWISPRLFINDVPLPIIRQSSFKACPWFIHSKGSAGSQIFGGQTGKISLICLVEGKSMTPTWHYSLLFLPATRSSPSQTLEGVLKSWHGALQYGPWLTLSVASGTTEIQGHHQVCRARRGCPRTLSRTTDANLDRAFFENAPVFIVPEIGLTRAPLGPPWSTVKRSWRDPRI